MKLIAFLQLYNESEKGNLRRCLNNCAQWADDIVIYDDCSTDDSHSIYTKYTNESNIIYGKERNFSNEIAHKQQLLQLTLSLNPDWICWMDGDAIFDRECTEGKLRNYMSMGNSQGIDCWDFHYVNMWKKPGWYRLDNMFNDLRSKSLWKNNGNLYYRPNGKLHQPQYPNGLRSFAPTSNHILHYGFAFRNSIINKYLTYKSYGQHGWDLDRLIDESTLTLEQVPLDWFPKGLVPQLGEKPTSETYNDVKSFNNWEQYVKQKDNLCLE
mgnify:CR=1 FL=1